MNKKNLILTVLLITIFFTAVYAETPELTVEKTVNPDEITQGDTTTITFELNASGTTTIRPELDIMFTIDTSGSMYTCVAPSWCNSDWCCTQWDDRIGDAKEAAKSFVDKLDSEKDRAGLVGFATNATLYQGLTNDFVELKNKIDSLSASGWTNIGDGVDESNQQLISSQNIKVQILLSDGEANRPTNDPVGHALAKADEAAQNGIIIYTISLGIEADEDLMQEIADITGGLHYVSPTSDDLQAIFDEIAEEVENIVASNIVIIDVLPEGVDPVEPLSAGCSYDEPTRTVTCNAGLMNDGDTKTISFDVLVTEIVTQVNESTKIEYDNHEKIPSEIIIAPQPQVIVIPEEPENQAPIAEDDEYYLPINSLTELKVLENDYDPDGDEILITNVTEPICGTVQIQSCHTYLLYVAPDHECNDSFEYTISDGELTDTATVTINVFAPLQLPVANTDFITINENETASIEVLLNDHYYGNPFELYSILDPPLHGIAIINGDYITYTNEGYGGPYNFVDFDSDGTTVIDIIANDVFEYNILGGGYTDSARVYITVNRAPYFTSTPVTSVIANEPYLYEVTAEDDDGDELTFILSDETTCNWISINSITGELTGLTTLAQECTVKIIVSDGASTAEQEFTLTVQPGNLCSVLIAPNPATVQANEQKQFTATGYDCYQNETEIPGLTWTTTVGTINETGLFTAQENTGTGNVCVIQNFESETTMLLNPGWCADVIVEANTPAKIKLTPENQTITAGQTITYTVFLQDEYGNNIEEITDSTNYEINEEAKGDWNANRYTSEIAGEWTVTATYEEHTNTTKLTVEAGEFCEIEIEPNSAPVTANEKQQFIATGYDCYGNETEIPFIVDWFTNLEESEVDETGWFSAQEKIGEGLVCVQQTPGEPSEECSKGDVDGDGLITWNDVLLAFDLVFNEEYNSCADMNDDEIITSGDAQAIFNLFLEQNHSACANVTIVPAEFAYMKITPESAIVTVNQEKQFTATPYDEFGNEIPLDGFEWAEIIWTTDVGEIDDGLFTAQSTSGEGQVCVEIEHGETLLFMAIEIPEEDEVEPQTQWCVPVTVEEEEIPEEPAPPQTPTGGTGGGGGGGLRQCTAEDIVYGEWSACVDGTQSRDYQLRTRCAGDVSVFLEALTRSCETPVEETTDETGVLGDGIVCNDNNPCTVGRIHNDECVFDAVNGIRCYKNGVIGVCQNKECVLPEVLEETSEELIQETQTPTGLFGLGDIGTAFLGLLFLLLIVLGYAGFKKFKK